MKHISLLLLSASFLLSAHSQTSDSLPGNTALPSSAEELKALAAQETQEYAYSVEDYFQKPSKSDFQFSPDGQYLSFREKDKDGKRHVYIQDTESGKITKAIVEGEDLVRGYGWANNKRLIYLKDNGGDENYHLYAANIDGSNDMDLTPFEGVKAMFSNLLKDQADYVIINMNKDNAQVFEPYKLNINTGEFEKLFENTDMSQPIMGYDFDKDGQLRGYTRQVNGTEMQQLYRTSADAEFEVIEHYDWQGSFGIIGFNYTPGKEHIAYVATNLGRDKECVATYDLVNKKQLEVLFENDTYDASSMSRSRKRNWEIDSYSYRGEKHVVVPVSKTYQKLHKIFKKEFGNKAFYISDVTDEEDKYLLYITSDKLYGKYYMYSVADKSFKMLINTMPQLKEEDMAEMRPIQFTSRDGFTVHGYLTIPKAAQDGQKVPMIVNPHGGPYGIRDSWGFNPETQLFASRGYATLQVNYRGSGGYGKEFYLAGSKQIGRNMLNDLEDGVKYCIEKGWVAEDKVAIYGGSYGGLATLGSLIKTPELYVCGVDYVGVSNLFTFVNSFPAYWKPYMAQFYAQWYDPDNPEEKKIMEEVSPALNVDKLNKPLFVVQGANDPRVNIDESDQIVSQMRERGYDVPYMVKYNEGHGFHHEENRIELYSSMMGFFAKYLK